MRIVLPASMVLAVIVASIGISTWAYLAQREEALRRADDLIASLEQRIRTQVDGYLAPVAGLTRLARDLLGDGALERANEGLTERFALGVLENDPQVAIATFADPQGNFLMYVRTPHGGVDTKRIERTAAGVRTSWIRRDANGAVTAVEEVEDDGYDPRVRPWYIGAQDADAPFWSDVYVFFTSRRPGVTVSLPVPGPDGGVAAVYGMDITLENLSTFLSTLEIGRSGQAMIIGDGGRQVAASVASLPVLDVDGVPRTATVEEVADPVLLRAYNRYRVEGLGRRVIEVAGTRYLNSVASLESIVGRPWSIMIVAPEGDFTQVVEGNYRRQLVLNFGVLAVAALLAALVVNQGLRADRIQRRAAARERELAGQIGAFAELITDDGLHDYADREALRRVTKALASVLGVARVSLWRWTDDRSTLVCEDCHDRRTSGHIDGARLAAASMPELAGALDEPLAVLDPRNDARTRALDEDYFEHLGVECFLSAPVRHGGAAKAVLWVEDLARDADWVARALPYVTGVAALLGLRFAGAGGASAAPAPAASPLAPAGTPGASPVPGQFRTALATTDLNEERLRRLRGAGNGASAAADLYEHVSVLVLVLEDAEVWGRACDTDDASSHADRLVRLADARAEALGVPYVKTLGERVVCAAGFDGDAGRGAAAVAALAIELEEHCTSALTALDHRLAFRIGIDTGPALGAALGGRCWIYNLWGDAVSGAQAMAESAVAGTIQVGASTYALLREHHLFTHRGHYYVHELGETSTYLLLGST